jgi:hypothetical protein
MMNESILVSKKSWMWVICMVIELVFKVVERSEDGATKKQKI